MALPNQKQNDETSGLTKAFQYAAAFAYALAGENPALGVFTANYLSDLKEARKHTPQP